MNDEIQRLHTHDEFKEAEIRARIKELQSFRRNGMLTSELSVRKSISMRIKKLKAELEQQLIQGER